MEYMQTRKSIAHGFNCGWKLGLQKPEAQGGFGDPKRYKHTEKNLGGK
jgi:hypothetical protein